MTSSYSFALISSGFCFLNSSITLMFWRFWNECSIIFLAYFSPNFLTSFWLRLVKNFCFCFMFFSLSFFSIFNTEVFVKFGFVIVSQVPLRDSHSQVFLWFKASTWNHSHSFERHMESNRQLVPALVESERNHSFVFFSKEKGLFIEQTNISSISYLS